MTNPFKTKQFKAEFEKWNKILQKSGHNEIEDFRSPDAPLKCWHNLKWRKSTNIIETSKYYDLAVQLVQTYPFESKQQLKIWTLHAEGLSIRKIAQTLKQRKTKKSKIHGIITRIQLKSGLR